MVALQQDGILPQQLTVRTSRSLNTLVEQDHRRGTHHVRPMRGFGSVATAAVTRTGIARMQTLRKGQYRGGWDRARCGGGMGVRSGRVNPGYDNWLCRDDCQVLHQNPRRRALPRYDSLTRRGPPWKERKATALVSAALALVFAFTAPARAQEPSKDGSQQKPETPSPGGGRK